MFGNKKTEENSNSSKKTILPSSNSGGINSLVQDTSVEGDITSGSDIRIDGFLKGTLDCKAKVIIGSSGKVEGKITCQHAVIEGSFSGNLTVKEILDVRQSASIDGEIQTGRLIVESGATFNVNCNMGAGSKSIKKKLKEGELVTS